MNADLNCIDRALSEKFSWVLKEAGFVFTARLAAGKGTILKPFNDGYFLVDAIGAVFHLKRKNGKPWVRKTPPDPVLWVRSIKSSESRCGEFYGLLFGKNDCLFLISYDNYRLIPLTLEGCKPDEIDFRLIINPFYRTVVYSDHKVIQAAVMDLSCRPLARYSHTMPGAEPTRAQNPFSYLVPFRFYLRDPNHSYRGFGVTSWGWRSVAVLAWAMLIYLIFRVRSRRLMGRTLWLDCLVVLPTVI